MSERMFEALAAEAAKRTTPAPGDVIVVGREAGCAQRVVVHSTELAPNGHEGWVRMIVTNGAVILMKLAEVEIAKRFDAPSEGGDE